ncbi:globin domain-containing protein [Algibacillus agarilyticus]|uniref:globin domain-containing protein n=1 Tax=Algibacillus agarilyticus TaxID=2234133 RepID=UPI001300B2D6|nr:globin domain-containing protein [Algibacillus agarilyticus]
MSLYIETFNDSYERVVKKSDEFYTFFYQLFMARDPAINKLFDGVDIEHQISMLNHSLVYMIVYSGAKVANSEIQKLADFHQNEIKVQAYMYDIWLDCLIEAVQAFDPRFNADTEAAWRDVLGPSILIIKGKS